ncbi:hypothetical protein [Jiangella muralis]|uniref:hypothetical protein n=1 Tax=Jiangella muralis TaxID=702383 RepID=UPI00069E2CC2|nr:hypothetical protein [Jiangella muralis]
MITAAPSPAPTIPPRPHGNLDTATAEQIAVIADQVWPVVQSRSWERRAGLRVLLALLAEHPGQTWQERWLASGLDAGTTQVRDLFALPTQREHAGHALKVLFCLRVIRPSLPAFRASRFKHYFQFFEAAQADPALDRFLELVEQTNTSPHYKRCARMDIAGALTTQGIELADLTAEGLLHHAIETRRGRYGAGYEHHIGHLAWQVLHESGHFPSSVPATLRGAMRAPAMTPAELVDSYQLVNRDVAEMLTRYLTRRSHDLDYSTLRGLARDLCDIFWREIETINPAQADLALSEGSVR